MHKKFFIAIALLTLISLQACSKADNAPKAPAQGKSAGEVINEYTNTLVESPKKARAAANAEDDRTNRQDQAIKALDGAR